MKTELSFFVEGQTLSRIDNNKIIGNTNNVYVCHFDVPVEWDGLILGATFKRDRFTYNVLLDKDNYCGIPTEILKDYNNTSFEVALYGIDSDATITTTICEIPVIQGTPFFSASANITPSIYEQIMHKISEIAHTQVSPEIVSEVVEQYLAEHPIENVDIAQEIADYFTQHPIEGVSAQDIAQAVSAYFVENPIENVSENDITQAVSDYLAQNPIEGVSANDVAQAVSNYFVENPIESVNPEDISQAVNAYLVEHPANVTENDIKNAISLIDGIEEIDSWMPISLTAENSEEVTGYLNANGGIGQNSNRSTIVTLPVQEGEQYLISAYSAYASKIYVLFDAGGNVIFSFPDSNSGVEKKEVEVTIPANVVTMKVGTFKIQAGARDTEPITISKHIESGFRVTQTTPEVSDADVERAVKSVGFGDVLANKKWAACGDSYTIGYFDGYVDANGNTGTSSDAYDADSGHWKTYPWWIAKRNNMTVQWLAQAGNDFTNVEGALRPFSAQGDWVNYTQVDADCDYITLAFGLNEMHMEETQIGTKNDSDNTTLWGAYNVVMEALIRANPFAKIGIIITDSWLPTWYRDVLIEIAKYWGVPYLDLKAGENVPAGIGGRNGNTVAQSIRDAVYTVSSSNSHPSLKAHEFRSTIIENFLRSL